MMIIGDFLSVRNVKMNLNYSLLKYEKRGEKIENRISGRVINMGWFDNIIKSMDSITNRYYYNNYMLYALIALIALGLVLILKAMR